MTYQEVMWQGKLVWITGILSNSGRMHRALVPYVGRAGHVVGESKNGQLLVHFAKSVVRYGEAQHLRCIPAGCVAEHGKVKCVWP